MCVKQAKRESEQLISQRARKCEGRCACVRERRRWQQVQMASNELAAILARRRAKAGGDSDDPPAPAIEKSSASLSSSSSSSTSGASSGQGDAPAQPRSSIAERIARLKAQGAGASAAAAAGGSGGGFNPGAPKPRAVPIFMPPPRPSATSNDDADTVTVVNDLTANEPQAAVTTSEPVNGENVDPHRRTTSERIQQLQGMSVGGINVNPFRPGGATYVIPPYVLTAMQ